MNNKELLNEGFFSKKNKKDNFPTYQPLDKKLISNIGFNAVDSRDRRELEGRLTKTFGMSLGNNTVKNMADKAVKKFPIIISENVDPNTAVMLKNYLEQQYAEYLNLLISNQVIDITQYDRHSSEGNIAIQALNQVTGTDFSKQRIANRAMTGRLTSDDIFANEPLYKLLKQESYSCGDPNVDSLLEDAIIIDSSNADKVVDLLEATYSMPFSFDGNNASTYTVGTPLGTGQNFSVNGNSNKNNNSQDYLDLKTGSGLGGKTANFEREFTKKRADAEEAKEDLYKRGYVRTTEEGFERYDKLTNTEVVVDPRLFQNAINKSVGDILLEDKYLQDRFTKACWLLQSRKISGKEYISYVTERLGFPIKQETYRYIIFNYPESEVIGINANQLSQEEARKLASNTKEISRIVDGIAAVPAKNVLKNSLIVAGSGAIGASGIGLTIAGVSMAAIPVVGWIIGGAAAAGGLGALIAGIKMKRKKGIAEVPERQITGTSKYKSWEKVEAMIDAMDSNTYALNTKKLEWLENESKKKNNQKVIADPTEEKEKIINDARNEDKGVSYEIKRFANQLLNIFKNQEPLKESSDIEPILGYVPLTEEAKRLARENYQELFEGFNGYHNGELAEVRKQVKEKEEELKKKQADIEEKSKLIAKLGALINKNKGDYSDKIKELQIELGSKIDELDSIKKDLEDAKKELEDLKKNKAEQDDEYEKFKYGIKNFSGRDNSAQMGYLLHGKDEKDNRSAYEKYKYYKNNRSLFENADYVLTEAPSKISLTTPSDIFAAKKSMPNLTVMTYDPDNTALLPSYGTRGIEAYGSVEYDRRELKDRKFNTPLILTIKFKERYSDGKYADNELTAVIGILGVVTRVPSEEMEYILAANAQGNTIKGIFSGDSKGSLGDLLASFKNTRLDTNKLPQSADVWKNLEKVSQLAVANALSGRANNNIANAHIIFSQKEADTVRQELGVDYLRDKKLSASLMKRYSAMNLMIANDSLERVFIFNDIDANSWDVVPYETIRGRSDTDMGSLLRNSLGRL